MQLSRKLGTNEKMPNKITPRTVETFSKVSNTICVNTTLGMFNHEYLIHALVEFKDHIALITALNADMIIINNNSFRR